MGRALGQGRYGNVLLRAMLHGAGRARQGYQLTDLEQLMAGAHLPADMRTPRRRGEAAGRTSEEPKLPGKRRRQANIKVERRRSRPHDCAVNAGHG